MVDCEIAIYPLLIFCAEPGACCTNEMRDTHDHLFRRKFPNSPTCRPAPGAVRAIYITLGVPHTAQFCLHRPEHQDQGAATASSPSKLVHAIRIMQLSAKRMCCPCYRDLREAAGPRDALQQADDKVGLVVLGKVHDGGFRAWVEWDWEEGFAGFAECVGRHGRVVVGT
jgi:hypothetical protein